MGVKQGSCEETEVHSRPLEFDDTSNVRSTYFSSDDDNDNGLVTPKVKVNFREPRLEDLEKNGVYDREAILHYLAKLAMSGNGGEFINDVIRSHRGFINSETEVTDALSKIDMDEKLTPEDRHYSLVDELRETLKSVPDSLLHLTTGLARPGDCGRPADQKPDWLDMDKFRRGQKFAQDNMFSAFYTTDMGLLFVYSFEDGLKPFIFTGKTAVPFTAFKRYLSTGLKFRRWYTQDIWDKGTRAWKDLSTVRAMHTATRKKMKASTIEEIDAATTIPNANCHAREIMMEDFVQACEAPAMGQCPYRLGQGSLRPENINQTDMVITQWGFVALLISYPERFGVHYATDEDLEAFCYLWRSIGYQLGIEDEYNFCRGTLEDIRKRSRELIDFWIKPNLREITPEWEHMTRTMIGSLAPLLPCPTLEIVTVHLMETLGLPMPRLYATFSFMDRFVYNLMTGFLRYGMKVPGVSFIVKKVFDLLLDHAAHLTPVQLESLRVKFGE